MNLDPLHAVVFDMDGTLIDSERVLMQHWLAAAAAEAWALSAADYLPCIGLNSVASDQHLARVLGSAARVEHLRRAVQTRLLQLPAAERFPLKPGARALLEALQARGVPCALASSSTAEEIAERLAAVGVDHFFAATAGGSEVPHGKPDPAVYRLATQRLGIEARYCVAIEDSTHGVASARAAGARVILVPDVREPEAAAREAAARVLPALADVLPVLQEWGVYRP
jgi:HAD superfamily hydrolase (TIGR01509 family)